MKIIKEIDLFTFFLISFEAIPRTTGIVSGKYTPNGRLLLFKQRDKGMPDNKIMHLKMSLKKCAALADFDRVLLKTMFFNTYFGVIDNKVEAAYHEIGDSELTKFDANNHNTIHIKYIIRTFFSFSRGISKYLDLRKLNIDNNLFYQASITNSLTHQFIQKDVSHSLKHGVTDMYLYDTFPDNVDCKYFIVFRDFTSRYSILSFIVIQVVKKRKNPTLTTMWALIGSFLFWVTRPVRVIPEQYLSKKSVTNKTSKPLLRIWSLLLKKLISPFEKGEEHDYINLSGLVTKDKNGILQKTSPIEDKIIKEGYSLLYKCRKSGLAHQEQAYFYNRVAPPCG